MRPRSESFFVDLTLPFQDIYLPKQASLAVRPVQRIVVYGRNQCQADPTTLDSLLDATQIPLVTLTLRDRNDQELMTDVPAWMFGENVQFAKPGPITPVMHGKRRLADLPIDPQRTSARWNNATVTQGKWTLCIEFVYSV